MSSPDNLTDRITHLRDRKGKANFSRTDHSGKTSRFKKLPKSSRERRFATDFFMIFAYSLLGVAILSQLFLIIWMDIV
ncbi:MAG: hypothetical protein ACJAYS_000026 [Lentimonas sp.]|jgi:hypothetical protein